MEEATTNRNPQPLTCTNCEGTLLRLPSGKETEVLVEDNGRESFVDRLLRLGKLPDSFD